MKLLRGQKLCSRYKSNRVFLDLSSNQRWDNFYEKKSQHAGFNIIYKYNINKLMGREGEVRVLMNTLNSSFLFDLKMFDYYLAQNLWFWTGIIFIRVYVSVCLCVCVWRFISIISKNSWPILMKLGRMIYNDKRQVPFEDELNRFIRTEVTENPYFYFSLLRPFDYIFPMLLPFVHHRRGKMQLAS